jgi:hypothetical protein
MKKMGKEQIDLLKLVIEEFVNTRVYGGFDTWIDLWRRHAMNTGDWKADYLQMGMDGWNGYSYRSYVNIHSVWKKCKFDEHMTYVEFYMIFDSLWVSVSVRMIKNLIGDTSDELAY